MDWSAIHNSLTSLSFYVMLWLQWGQTTNIFILLCKILLNQSDEFTLWLEVIKRVLASKNLRKVSIVFYYFSKKGGQDSYKKLANFYNLEWHFKKQRWTKMRYDQLICQKK